MNPPFRNPLRRSAGRSGRWAAIVFLAGLAVIAASLPAAPATRPNFVFLLADDLGYGDLACFGHPEIRTPHLDALAAEGLKLTAYYSPAAVCSPARAGIMTGRTPNRAGIYGAIPFLSPIHLRPGEITLPALLHQSGYATAQVGKWHLNGYFNLFGQPQPGHFGFDHWFAVQNNALPNHRNPENFVRNGTAVGRLEGYSGPIVAAEAVRWLQSGRDRTKPFFLYVPLHEPHEPVATDEQFSAPYRERHPDDPSRVAYYGNVTQMDAAVGRILAELKRQGLEQDTVVWFASDNGPARTTWHNAGSSGGFRSYKGNVYEGGIRVPGIIRWPGRIRPGSTSSQPVSGVDVLPTFCELAGVALPENRPLDGISITSIFTGGAPRRTRPLYWQYLWVPAGPQVALRDGPWKILARIEAPRPRGGGITAEIVKAIKSAPLAGFELYQIEDDPAEKNELSAREPARLAELKAALLAFHAGVGAEAPVWPDFQDPRYEQQVIQWPDYKAKPLTP